MHQNIGAMVIGAGIINTLLEFVKNQRRDRFIVSSLSLPRFELQRNRPSFFLLSCQPAAKAITLLDGFLYGYSQAFTAYLAAGGLAIFVDRIKVPSLVRLTTAICS